MAVMQMQRVSICALNKYRKNLLEDVQKLGFVEIDESVDLEHEFEREETQSKRSVIVKNVSQAEKTLEILDVYAPRKLPPFASLKGKPALEKDIYTLGADKENEIVSCCDKIVDIDRDIVAFKANIVKLQNQIEELAPWMDLDVPMNYSGTKSSNFFVGTISESLSEREIEEKLSIENPDIAGYSITTVSKSADMTYLAVLCLKDETRALEEALRHIGFAKPSSLTDEIPSVAKAQMEKEIEDNQKEIESLTGEISGLAGNYEDIQMFSDYSRIRAQKYEILASLPKTKSAFAMEGFVPKEYADSLSSSLEKYDAIVEIRDLTEDEEAPVLFKNGWFGSVGEGTVESFGLPNKREIDPSTIMMIFYVVFFGLMLSDAAYGAVLSLATGIVLVKFPKIEAGMKKLLQLFFLCGFSTLAWGVLFGGYFGDVVDVVARTFFGVQIPAGESIMPALWFVPINDPMRMLIYSLFFGIIHMFVGLFIAAYQNIKNKETMPMLTTISTGLFVLGLILILLPTELFGSIAGSGFNFNFPPVVGTIAKVITIVGLAGIILFAAADTKNPALRVLLGLYEVYNDITGWLSDTLSYSRLLALGLATGVIAQVFNQLGSMFGGGVIGAILFIVIFIIGHVFNLAINVLGAYVHTCRLQYVEFFGKFYEGGGRKFMPFFADTKYVDIKGGK